MLDHPPLSHRPSEGGSKDHTTPERPSFEPRPPGWSKRELMAAADISGKSFDTIRKAARIKGPSHGGLDHLFVDEDMFALIQKAEGGRFTLLGPAAARAWRELLREAGVVMPENISRTRR